MKRHHDQPTSYKWHLVGAGLQVLRFSPLSSSQEAWQHPGRHGTGGAESFTSCSKGKQENWLPGVWKSLNDHSHSGIPPPIRLHILIVPLPGPSIFKPPHTLFVSFFHFYVLSQLQLVHFKFNSWKKEVKQHSFSRMNPISMETYLALSMYHLYKWNMICYYVYAKQHKFGNQLITQ